jgi:hypothetical protein
MLKKRDNVILENDFDFQDIFHSHEHDEAIAGFIHGIIKDIVIISSLMHYLGDGLQLLIFNTMRLQSICP